MEQNEMKRAKTKTTEKKKKRRQKKTDRIRFHYFHLWYSVQ